jgi:triosephosphate isomerase (TIM)
MTNRKPIIAGNWKLNGSRELTTTLVDGLLKVVSSVEDVDIVICPPFTALAQAAEKLHGSKVIKLGAQNCYWEESGAFTGEIAPAMLKELGVDYVIIGHSERRQFFGETDETVNKKLKALLAQGLTPIVCVGEMLEEREAGKMEAVIKTQITGSLAGLSAAELAKIVVAYEPVWAIGTGKTASPEQAQEVHALIRGLLAGLADKDTADKIRIQYGGSVKPDNAAELMSCPDIDGALVGGAALKADSFAGIVKFEKK